MFGSTKRRGLELQRFFNPRQPVLSIASKTLTSASESHTVRHVTDLMLNRFRRIPLTSGSKEFRGLVTITDVLDFLGGGEKFALYRKKAKGIDVPVKHIKTDNVYSIMPGKSISKALETFREHGKGAYPLIEQGQLKGMISEWDFVERMNAPIDVTVEQLMTYKPIMARKNYTVGDATRMMCRGGFRRLPVTENGIILGIITPYDILSYLGKGERVSKHKLQKENVGRVMNRFVTTITPEATISDAIRIMRNKKVGGLPVVEDEELVGIITERDILNALVY